MKKSKSAARIKIAIGSAVLLLLAAALAFVYLTFGEKAVSGSKAITITIVNSAAQETAYSLKTDAEYLLDAMEEAEGLTFSGTEGPYGLMLDNVNGEAADYNVNGAYWSVLVNGEYGNYGPSQQPVQDGDAFTLVYTR